MANTKQSKKRVRQNNKRRIMNASRKTTVRTAIKKVRKAAELGDKAAAQTSFIAASSIIDKMVGKVLHKNTANRYKSRLSTLVKSLSETSAS